MTPVEVLVAHQRRDIESCLCGWAVLGASHAQYQVDALEAAGYRIQKLRPVTPEMRVKLRGARDELLAGGPVGVMRYCQHCRTATGRDADGVVWPHARDCPRL